MKISPQKKLIALLLFSLVNLAVGANAVFAQVQQTSVAITGALSVDVPTTLQIGQQSIFLNKVGQTITYWPFNPNTIANKVIAYDTRNNGGFTVDLTVTDFTSGANVIPYTNLSITTLASSQLDLGVDSATSNIPSDDDSGTVTSPLDCNWDGSTDFGTYCENPTIPQTGFSNSITTFTGTGATSAPKLIIDGRNPTSGGRIGQYSNSLGIKLAVDEGTRPGNYQSIFTFSINPA